MGYCEYMKDLLSPFGVYRLENSVNEGELYAIGKALDGADEKTKEAENECTVPTSKGYGLEMYEKLFLKTPVSEDLETRKNALMSLMQIDDMGFTKEALNRAISGCGIKAEVQETEKRFIVEVTFPGTRGMPDGIDVITKRIEEILPCHIGVDYSFVFPQWRQLEAAFPTWGDIEKEKMTVNKLERFDPEEGLKE